MSFIWFLLISMVSGVLAGMGMGGGTLLIPAITLIMNVEQNLAQATNLLVFVPCAIIVCIIYTKSKIVNYKCSWLILIVAIILSIIASLVAVKIENKILSICFGIFLILLGIFQLILSIFNGKKNATGYLERKKI